MAETVTESSGPIASGSMPNSEGTASADANSTKTRIRRPKGKGNCNNKIGNNQYKDRPRRDDPHVAEILKAYHIRGITDSRLISKMLLDEHSITLCEGSVNRRRKLLGLRASGATTRQLDETLKQELILEQIRKDGTGRIGARTVKIRIFEERGIHLTRDYIREQMKHLDPAYDARGNKHVKAKRRAKILEMQLQQEQAASQVSADQNSSANLNLAQHPPEQHEQDQDQEPFSGVGQDLSPSRQQRRPITRAPQAPPSIEQPMPSVLHSTPDSADSARPHDTSDSEDNYPGFEDYTQFNQDMAMDVDTFYAPAPASSSINPNTNNGAPSAPPSQITRTAPRAVTVSKIAALKMIQETTPKIQELTRLIGSLHPGVDDDSRSANVDESLTQEEVDLVLKGMEAAALLERQLARMCSWKKNN